ncbi:unnamed protein product [Ceutorhynchus assimilis]|uniref:procollagen-proline 3-dioxygenase n=1 Tax=Ceutorhynchus assimilis TaxID=467358 RepID=A0A9N9MD31_9CUCU|nr:unnamed protein product [Ceutorhynchus assimilis]
MYIADTFASMNDGYHNDKVSPHTKYEKFEGITLSRITFLVYIGVIKAPYLQLLLELTEIIQKKMTEKFNIEKQLYFSYTHLVCRSALTNNSGRTDFSHMVHADNCNLLSDVNCEKKSPAFSWRDYSTILYLNDDFDGGEFVFASDSKGRHIQSTITPKCGRMVAFSSGKENLHGVKAVRKGKRCAIAVWFTLDSKYKEFDRDIARHMLDNGITFDQYFDKQLKEFLVSQI